MRRAMYNRRLILPLILVSLVLVTLPFWYQALTGQVGAAPKLELPAGKDRCIESTPYMRSHHVDLLNTWKETVVRQGERVYMAGDGKEYTMSLTNTCIECHKDKAKFCDRCHNYVQVSPTCWSCHNVPKEETRGTTVALRATSDEWKVMSTKNANRHFRVSLLEAGTSRFAFRDWRL